jgi:chromosome segregation ATPase
LFVEKQISDAKRKEMDSGVKIQHSRAESQKIQNQINMLESELNKAKQDLASKTRELSQATSMVSKFDDEWHADQAVLIQKKKIADQKEFEVKKHESEKAFKLRELETKKRALSELDTKKHNLELQLQQLKRDSEAMARDVRQLLHS